MSDTTVRQEGEPVDALERVLISQIELLERTAVEHRELQSAVIGRDWRALEEYMSRLNVRSGELSELERQRHDAYRRVREQLGLDGDDGFFEVLTRLENGSRSRLAELYRNLKVAVMRLAGQNGNLESYVSASSETLEQVLGELFPQRKGTIYGRSGVATAKDSRAFVVNRTL